MTVSLLSLTHKVILEVEGGKLSRLHSFGINWDWCAVSGMGVSGVQFVYLIGNLALPTTERKFKIDKYAMWSSSILKKLLW